MNEIIKNIEDKVEYNQKLLDSFDYLIDMNKKLDEILVLVCDNKGSIASEKLSFIGRDELIKYFVTFLRFYDTKDEQEKIMETVDFFLYDGKVRDLRIKKFNLLFTLSVLIYEMKFKNSEEIFSEMEKYKKRFSEVYGADFYEVLEELSCTPDFSLIYTILYNYNDVIHHDYKSENTCIRIDILRHTIAVSDNPFYDKYIEDEDIRVDYALLLLDTYNAVIKQKIEEYRKELRKIRKENSVLLTKLEKLKRISDKLGKEMISPSVLSNILDDSDESIKILSSIAKSNSDLVSETEKEFTLKEKLIYILYSYHYNFDELSSEFKNNINSINIDILKENLDKLKGSHIVLSNTNLEYIINYNKLIDFDRLKPFISRGVIYSLILNNNIKLLTSDEEFNNFYNNIKLFEDFNINITDVAQGHFSLFFINHEYLKSILNIYTSYDIKIDGNNLIRFVDTNNLDVIDLFIEEGYGDFILSNLDYLDDGENIAKRIHINNLVESDSVYGGSINSDLLSEGSFFVSDRYLDDACSSKVSYFQNKEIKDILDNSFRTNISKELSFSDLVLKLDSNYKDSNSNIYSFDGIIISRNKVLRNLEALKGTNYSDLDKVFNSVIYNSLLGVDDLKTISSEIKKLFGITKELN